MLPGSCLRPPNAAANVKSSHTRQTAAGYIISLGQSSVLSRYPSDEGFSTKVPSMEGGDTLDRVQSFFSDNQILDMDFCTLGMFIIGRYLSISPCLCGMKLLSTCCQSWLTVLCLAVPFENH